jgi:hypothetical protein
MKKSKRSMSTRELGLRMGVKCRVEWVTMSDPMFSRLNPSTWGSKTSTFASKTRKNFKPTQSLANSIVNNKDPSTNAAVLHKCSQDSQFSAQMCREIGVPDFESLKFYLQYGQVSTQHRLQAAHHFVHPGHIDCVLMKVCPLTYYHREKTVMSSGFYHHTLVRE